MVKHCVICGCELESQHWNAKYCAECKKDAVLRQRREAARRYSRRCRELEQMEREARRVCTPPQKSLEQLAREARETGMSYGKYVASRGIV